MGGGCCRLGVSESCPVSPLGTVMRLTLYLYHELCQCLWGKVTLVIEWLLVSHVPCPAPCWRHSQSAWSGREGERGCVLEEDIGELDLEE